MKVLGIGEVVLDKICLLQQYPEEGSKVQPMKSEHSIGGPVPAALILLSRLGVETTLLASVGDDSAGKIIKKKLEKENVTLIPNIQKSTKVNTILTNSQNGSRTIIRDSVNHNPIVKISAELLSSADLIIFDRHEPKAFDYVMQHKKPETKVIVDPSTEVSAKTLKMLGQVDYPIIPYEILKQVRRHEDYRSNLEHLYSMTIGKNIVVTVGGLGTMVFDGLDIDLVPAVEINCVDANGAGDIFRGAFGYGVLNDWDMRKTVEFANMVAGLQCTKLGNGSAIPYRHEIEDFEKLKQHKVFTMEQLVEVFNS